MEEFGIGDEVSIPVTVVAVYTSGAVDIMQPGGQKRYIPPKSVKDLKLIKKAPKPEPVEPLTVYAIVKLVDEHGMVRVAIRRTGFDGPGQFAWLVSGYPGAYSWKTLLDRFGRKGVYEVTATTAVRTEPATVTIEARAPYHPYAYVDDVDRVHFRDRQCPHLYRHADDPEERLTVEELARENNGSLTALHLEGERP